MIVFIVVLVLSLAYLIGWWLWWASYVEELLSLGVDEAEANRMARKYFWHFVGKDPLAHADRDFCLREPRA